MRNNCGGIHNNKGIVLFFVIMLIFMETILAGVILGVIRSNDRNTAYRISRIKAQYAVNAAWVYTRARLYTNTWSTNNYALCPTAAKCTGVPPARRLIDYEIPYRVNIAVSGFNTGPLGSRRVTLTTDYTSPL